MQRLAEPAVEHELELVVQELGEVRADGGGEHADALEDGLFGGRVFLSVDVHVGSCEQVV